MRAFDASARLHSMEHGLPGRLSPSVSARRAMSPTEDLSTAYQNTRQFPANMAFDPRRSMTNRGLPSTTHFNPSGSPRSFHTSPRIQQTGTPTSSVGRAAYSMSPPPPHASFSELDSMTAKTEMAGTRTPPPRNITNETIEDAYVQFILYANPGISRDVDTTELRRAFRAPPKSDGRSFDVFTIWELVRLLDSKELKSWSELVTRLGVEPPSVEKGQSVQKIQQYGVRLRRFLHAMHIDSFFEYCLDKPHDYYLHRPSLPGQTIRDGVSAQEDLALRALCPEYRPKRGRRKAGDHEEGDDLQKPTAKKPHHETSATPTYGRQGSESSHFPENAMPWGGFAEGDEERSLWALSSNSPVTFHAHDQDLTSVPYMDDGRNQSNRRRGLSSSPYPTSAIVPRQANTVSYQEPRSAITLSTSDKSRSRRRRAPAVSSAWLGSSGTAKHRGRPPNDQTSEDGAFGTFPAKANVNTADANTTKHLDTVESQSDADVSHNAQHIPGRRLQLLVPQNSGRPIRLATPPTVLVNGDSRPFISPDRRFVSRRTSADFFRNPEESEDQQEQSRERENFDFTLEDVCYAFASELMRAKLIGRPLTPLSMEEAKIMAVKVVESICKRDLDVTSSIIYAVRCAFLLGVEKQMGLGSSGNQYITIRAVLQHSSVAGGKWGNSGQEVSGSYNYTISLDRSVSDTMSSNVQISSITVPTSVAEENVSDELDELRKYLTSAAVGRSSSSEKATTSSDSKLQRLRRMMLEVVMATE